MGNVLLFCVSFFTKNLETYEYITSSNFVVFVIIIPYKDHISGIRSVSQWLLSVGVFLEEIWRLFQILLTTNIKNKRSFLTKKIVLEILFLYCIIKRISQFTMQITSNNPLSNIRYMKIVILGLSGAEATLFCHLSRIHDMPPYHNIQILILSVTNIPLFLTYYSIKLLIDICVQSGIHISTKTVYKFLE